MATTDELIRDLATDVRPLPSGAAWRRLAGGIVLGMAGSLITALAWLGQPLQTVSETGTAVLAMKLLYSAALFGLCSVLLLAAGRPGVEVRKRWLWLFVPPTVLAVSAATELSMALPQQRSAIWLGSMWWMCFLTVTLLSVPVFAGVLWAFQGLAPTRLRLAGLLSGLTAGSAAATIYALYCPERTATFVLSWYSLAIVAAGFVGALAGPKLLRW